jgi:D-sedoheptulose 7-phosphate isomerase
MNIGPTYSFEFLRTIRFISVELDSFKIDEIVHALERLRETGTLYILGLGGSAANASHMAADLRKLCQIDARSLDNVAEITARANDEGFSTIFDGLLVGIGPQDAIFVLSVGGGTDEVSKPIVRAIDRAKKVGARIFGIVGPIGGRTSELGDCVIKIPAGENPTPYTEAFQLIISHLLCSHPSLQRTKTKW